MLTRAEFDEYYVKDLNEFNDTVQTLVSEHKEVYFRGVSQARYKLSPSITRPPAIANPEKELQLFTAFRRRIAMYKSETYRDYTSVDTQSDLETLAIAQHNGLKTRLLDWSTNPLASLWFACEKVADPKADDYCVVWVLVAPDDQLIRNERFIDPKSFDFVSQEKTGVYVPNIVNQRLRNQCGLFSVHYYDKGDCEYVALDDDITFFPSKFGLRSGAIAEWNLIKILINRSLYGQDILENLRRFDIHVETIYPSLESVGERLNYDFELGSVL